MTVLAGGVGAAKLLRGLSPLLDPRRLTVIVNTGDDEEFFGLHVSPDVDTILYTLAGRVHPEQGWGIAGDSFHCLPHLRELYGDAWFQLGDRDLATHIFRTDLLRRGESLSAITQRLASTFGLRCSILPMSDQKVRTFVHVRGRGALPFQDYLVKGRGSGIVEKIELRGARTGQPAPGVIEAIQESDLVVIPPSNPFVSIDPILTLRGVRKCIEGSTARVVAVSPIVRGLPIKGPLHRMLRGLGHEVSALGVARLYRGLADVFVLDEADSRLAPRIENLGMRALTLPTVMRTAADSQRLAKQLLEALHA